MRKTIDVQSDRLAKKIQVKDFKLAMLLDITKTINTNATVDELLELYKNILQLQLGIEKMVLFTQEDHTWICKIKYGVDGDVGDVRNEDFFNQSEKISLHSTASSTESFDIVVPVYHQGEPIAYLLVGDKVEEQIRVSPVIKHMNFIETLTNIILVAVKNVEHAEQKLVQEKMRHELEIASEMQQMLLPSKFITNEAFSVSGFYKPHSKVGGDYYDFIQLSETEFMICLADVSGKGVAAAFLMSNFQASLRAIYRYCSFDVEEVVRELNEKVMLSANGEKFITFFLAIYNSETRRLEYVNCGHNPPVLVDPEGTVELLSLGSYGLGMFDEIPRINKGTLDVKPNSTVFCYTDGLVELENNKNEEFGLEKLIEILKDAHHHDPEGLNAMMHAVAVEFKQDQPYVDDTTFLTCRIN